MNNIEPPIDLFLTPRKKRKLVRRPLQAAWQAGSTRLKLATGQPTEALSTLTARSVNQSETSRQTLLSYDMNQTIQTAQRQELEELSKNVAVMQQTLVRDLALVHEKLCRLEAQPQGGSATQSAPAAEPSQPAAEIPSSSQSIVNGALSSQEECGVDEDNNPRPALAALCLNEVVHQADDRIASLHKHRTTRQASYASVAAGLCQAETAPEVDEVQKYTPPCRIPRFALPTEATTRRNDETLRQHGTISPSKTPDKTAYKSSCGYKADTASPKTDSSSKRVSLPTAWLDGSTADGVNASAVEDDSPKTRKAAGGVVSSKRRVTTYMSPTKAAVRRSVTSQKSTADERKIAAGKTSLPNSAGATTQYDAIAEVMAEISASSKKLNLCTRPTRDSHRVANTTVTRRTSDTPLLGSIVMKLESEGLLKGYKPHHSNDPASTPAPTVSVHPDDRHDSCTSIAADHYCGSEHSIDSAAPERSYADALRGSPNRQILGVRGQTSAEIGKAIAIRNKRGLACPPYTHATTAAEQLDEKGESRHGLVSSLAASRRTSSDDTEGRATVISESQQSTVEAGLDAFMICTSSSNSNSSTEQASMPFTLNATAASFQPKSLRDSITQQLADNDHQPRYELMSDEEIFRMVPPEEWHAMPWPMRQERKVMRLRRLLEYRQREYNQPLTWRKDNVLAEMQLAYERNGSVLPNSRSDEESEFSNACTPSRNHAGWTVSMDHSGPTWSGGSGREIKCAGFNMDVENQKFKTYAYKNRRTGRTAIMHDLSQHTSPQDWSSSLDDVSRLEAAEARGYSKIPCSYFNLLELTDAMMPSACPSC